jgi:hypothetical protein
VVGAVVILDRGAAGPAVYEGVAATLARSGNAKVCIPQQRWTYPSRPAAILVTTSLAILVLCFCSCSQLKAV